MKKIKDLLFSMVMSVCLLLIFAVSIGYATFIENNSGTAQAQELVYNAKWFEVLLFLLVINLTGSILKYKLIQRKKWTVLMFHLAFICILLGSAITRYFGYEGYMHIREGETSNTIAMDKKAIHIDIQDGTHTIYQNYEVNFGAGKSNKFAADIPVGNKDIHIENKLFVPKAIETLEETQNGEPAVGIFVMNGTDNSTDFTLFNDETNTINNITFGFADKNNDADVSFSIVDNELYFKSKTAFSKTGTASSGMIDRKNAVTIPAHTLCKGEENTVYRVGGIVFMIRGYYAKASKTLTPAHTISNEMAEIGQDACVISITDGKNSRQVNIFATDNMDLAPVECNIGGTKVSISYGKMQKELPFSITLRKFELDRYPGSMSPSSYASEITVTDNEMKSVLPYRIYMNNILNYRGYRFFQSSYDEDELGTIFSVNHDYWGTLVSYIGYFFMFLGMVLTLFSKKSRFRTLMNQLNQMHEKRKQITTVIIAIVLASTGFITAQNEQQYHFEKLEHLLIQDGIQGRVEPFGSYASDVVRKISKHNSYKGKKATQVLIEMSVNPSLWKNELMIKVAHEGLANELGAINGYVSYNQMFDNNFNYKLAEQVDKAYRKQESQRNKYDKEVINVDERVNICTQIYMHNFLSLFPDKNSSNLKWNTSDSGTSGDSSNMNDSVCPFCATGGTMEDLKNNPEMADMLATGDSGNNEGTEMNDDSDETTMLPATTDGHCTRNDVNNPHQGMRSGNTGENLFENYLSSVKTALGNGNWQPANETLNKISEYQKKYGGNNLPSDTRIKLELLYNKLNVFINLMIAYAIVGLLLLALHFFYIFKPTQKLEKILNLAIYPLGFLFVLYCAGLGLRWYISGHAPWSNGYESMIFVGWAASLAGLAFSRKSLLAFTVTALLSAIALSVAAMSWMNPEITNLVPVLKSYWLVIHVAVITSSYGFLAMGAILGLLNLSLMPLRKPQNMERVNGIIQEISYIIEMTLIVGLFLLTIGTFLGGIWANESWGRYWGWDAKETWALVSVLVYAIIVHLRMIPKLNNSFILSAASLIGFGSVIMTFVGVNYYLSGMHSYGQGNPPPVPKWVYILILIIIAVVFLAYNSEQRIKLLKNTGHKSTITK
ncbi:MAG: cytochrome c biogenesis protein CcsA [Paludibacter sp.]|nr:cytochrome c biogenesis protein CcsA [Paludibacter sp.]